MSLNIIRYYVWQIKIIRGLKWYFLDITSPKTKSCMRYCKYVWSNKYIITWRQLYIFRKKLIIFEPMTWVLHYSRYKYEPTKIWLFTFQVWIKSYKRITTVSYEYYVRLANGQITLRHSLGVCLKILQNHHSIVVNFLTLFFCFIKEFNFFFKYFFYQCFFCNESAVVA